MAPQTMKIPKVLLNESNYRPACKRRKMKWENTLCLGLEWELENVVKTNNTRTEDLKKVDKVINDYSKLLGVTNPFYYKTDCSVNNGVEFVTVPITLQYVHNKMPLHEVAEFMNTNTNFKATHDCGIHVHLDRDFFTELELTKLRVFFSVNATPLGKFSKRQPNKLHDWAAFERGYTVTDFIHGQKKNDDIMHSRRFACSFCSNIFRKKKDAYGRIVPVDKPKTIEIRLFASTTNPDRLVAILQFCDALAFFIKTHSIIAISKRSCWKTFVEWCKDTNRYNHLIKELENDNLAS